MKKFENTYRPIPDNLELAKSPIDGYGIFAKFDLDAKIFIGITHTAPKKEELGRQRTPLGGFLNHSDNPSVNDEGFALKVDYAKIMCL